MSAKSAMLYGPQIWISHRIMFHEEMGRMFCGMCDCALPIGAELTLLAGE